MHGHVVRKFVDHLYLYVTIVSTFVVCDVDGTRLSAAHSGQRSNICKCGKEDDKASLLELGVLVM